KRYLGQSKKEYAPIQQHGDHEKRWSFPNKPDQRLNKKNHKHRADGCESFDCSSETVNGSYCALYAVRFTISSRYEHHGKVEVCVNGKSLGLNWKLWRVVVLDKTTILGVAVAPENFEGDLIGGHLQLMILNFSSTPVKRRQRVVVVRTSVSRTSSLRLVSSHEQETPWVRHIILQPLQGVHAARKISARKIPKNSSSWSVIDISALSLSILRYLMLASVFSLKYIMIYLSLLGFIQFNRGGVRKWLQNWNFQYLEKGKQEENTNSGDDGESLLCGGDGLCATFSPVYKSRDQNEEPMTWGFV
ncbi:hypothetical protein DVH24_021673, partial [Malus domestica]